MKDVPLLQGFIPELIFNLDSIYFGVFDAREGCLEEKAISLFYIKAFVVRRVLVQLLLMSYLSKLLGKDNCSYILENT